MTYNYTPIWKNIFYTSTLDELEYTIVDVETGDVIFKGRAYKFPDATQIKICINKICQYYLHSDIIPLLDGSVTGSYQQEYASREFVIKDSDGVSLESYTFWMDWSYKDYYFDIEEDYTLSRPINGHYATGMEALETYWEGGNYTIHTKKDSELYNVAACGDYALYYLNSFGGWDSFLIEGNVKRKDTLVNYNYEQTPQRVLTDWGTTRYSTEITPTYELVTGWLSDEQSENLASNLLTSTRVYLHNLKDDTIVPVLLTDTSVEHKTYATNGKKLSNYTIKVSESQTHYRR